MRIPKPTIKRMCYESGAPYWLVACSLDGKRYRKKHGSEEAARQDSVRIIRTATSGLTPAEHVATEQAIQMLKTSDNLDAREVEISFAVEWFCEHYVNRFQVKTIQQYYHDFMKIKEAQGRRPATITELQRKLGKFVSDYRHADVTTMHYEDIEPWILASSKNPSTRQRTEHIIKHFFGYLSGTSQNTPNPYPILRKSPFVNRCIIFQNDDADDCEGVIIFTAKECENLLREAQKFNAQRMFLWLMFTGMRPKETERFWGEERWGWNLISDDLKHIRVPKAISKTRRMRMIEVSPILRQWLMVYRKFPTFMTMNWQYKYRDVRYNVIPTEKLKADILRHTLISMMIKEGKGWAEIELQMGNTKEVQMRHYASLITSENEVGYFNGLTPEKFAHDIDEKEFRITMKDRQYRSLRNYKTKQAAKKLGLPVRGAA